MNDDLYRQANETSLEYEKRLSDLIINARAEVNRLKALINCPHNDDWFDGVRIEAAHQQERWGQEHDAGKEPPDWFWVLGYLSGKCLAACLRGDMLKAQHHTISSAALLLNWYRHLRGKARNKSMRPGIEPPQIRLDWSVDTYGEQL
jgi:hypothetical protein